MFKELGDLMGIMKQAHLLPAKMQEMSAELKQKKVTGSAGGGLVTMEANGLMEFTGCRIDPSLLESPDPEFLEDLILAAINQALSKARDLNAQSMQNLAGGMNLPMLNQALGGLGGFPTEDDDEDDDDESDDRIAP